MKCSEEGRCGRQLTCFKPEIYFRAANRTATDITKTDVFIPDAEEVGVALEGLVVGAAELLLVVSDDEEISVVSEGGGAIEEDVTATVLVVALQ